MKECQKNKRIIVCEISTVFLNVIDLVESDYWGTSVTANYGYNVLSNRIKVIDKNAIPSYEPKLNEYFYKFPMIGLDAGHIEIGVDFVRV